MKTVALMLPKKGIHKPEVGRPMHLLRCIPPDNIVKIWQNTDRNPRPEPMSRGSRVDVYE